MVIKPREWVKLIKGNVQHEKSGNLKKKKIPGKHQRLKANTRREFSKRDQEVTKRDRIIQTVWY